MNEYRCTRGSLYRHPCFGHDDLTARQGHYVVAKDEIDAILEMRRMFPHDPENSFTAHLWKKDVTQ